MATVAKLHVISKQLVEVHSGEISQTIKGGVNLESSHLATDLQLGRS